MSGWPLIAAALAGWTLLSVLIGLVVGKVIAFCTRVDSHLDPHPRVEPGDGTLGSTHPLDARAWTFPLTPYDRERRQG